MNHLTSPDLNFDVLGLPALAVSGGRIASLNKAFVREKLLEQPEAWPGKPLASLWQVLGADGLASGRAVFKDGRRYRVDLLAEENSAAVSVYLFLPERNGSAVQAAKMKALGEMACGIAHEINNPLAIIQARAGYLKDQAGKIQPAKLVEYAEQIGEVVERITKIIRGLRAFARDEEGEPFCEATVNSVVEDTLSFCRERFKNHGIRFAFTPAAAELKIRCRPVQISQVILNLLNNAFDSVADCAEKEIALKFEEDESTVAILVSDSGPGVAETMREKIFDPFFTTKDPEKGTGLGLSLSRGIMRSHGGELSLVPAAAGACFRATLPKASLCRK